VPHLESYHYHRDPLDVVGLGEDRSPNVGTDVVGNGFYPAVTMVPDRGERATPPIKIAISVDLAIGASAPVWAAAAIGGTTAAHAPAWSVDGVSAPVWAVTTAPLGVRGCPLRVPALVLPPSPA
jgi:hypothetical protein